MTDGMPQDVPRAPHRTRFRLVPLSAALALALHIGAALAVEPFVIKDIRVEGLQRVGRGHGVRGAAVSNR